MSRHPLLRLALTVALVSAPASGCAGDRVMPSEALMPEVVPHGEWEAEPPTGHVADALRRNLPPGDSLRFHDVTIRLHEILAPDGDVDSARVVLDLDRGEVRERRTVTEGAALAWHGMRIAVLGARPPTEAAGSGLVELEIATLESLPAEIAGAPGAGDASHRVRVPHEIRMITLHHTGSARPLGPEDDPVQRLRGLQSWGRADRNWWDVPYHFLIGLDGTVYEGRDYRFMGETSTAYDPHGHLLISVMGNYDLQEPTAAQLEAVMDLMAWGVAEFGLTTQQIRGHGELTSTRCPGENLRRHLEDGTFRRGVEERLRAAGYL